MPMIKQADAPTFSTPNAVMVTHAGPSRGSAELAMWRVRMAPAAQGPVHLIDREQVYLVMAGTLSILVGDEDHRAETGDAVIIPAGSIRQVRCEGPASAEAIVSMRAGGRVTLPDGEDRGLLPWAV